MYIVIDQIEYLAFARSDMRSPVKSCTKSVNVVCSVSAIYNESVNKVSAKARRDLKVQSNSKPCFLVFLLVLNVMNYIAKMDEKILRCNLICLGSPHDSKAFTFLLQICSRKVLLVSKAMTNNVLEGLTKSTHDPRFH